MTPSTHPACQNRHGLSLSRVCRCERKGWKFVTGYGTTPKTPSDKPPTLDLLIISENISTLNLGVRSGTFETRVSSVSPGLRGGKLQVSLWGHWEGPRCQGQPDCDYTWRKGQSLSLIRNQTETHSEGYVAAGYTTDEKPLTTAADKSVENLLCDELWAVFHFASKMLLIVFDLIKKLLSCVMCVLKKCMLIIKELKASEYFSFSPKRAGW